MMSPDHIRTDRSCVVLDHPQRVDCKEIARKLPIFIVSSFAIITKALVPSASAKEPDRGYVGPTTIRSALIAKMVRKLASIIAGSLVIKTKAFVSLASAAGQGRAPVSQ